MTKGIVAACLIVGILVFLFRVYKGHKPDKRDLLTTIAVALLIIWLIKF